MRRLLHGLSKARVRFLHDKSRLITIGTEDHTIIQWRFLSESDAISTADARRLSVAASTAGDGFSMISASPVGAAPNVSDDTSVLEEEDQQIEIAQQVGAYLESDSEDSDSDLSAVEIDSDIEKEKQISYDRDLYRDDYQKIKKLVKTELPAGEKRKKQPEEGLILDYVFGYRGYDCRDNVFCIKSGEIVYHVAALGIVLNSETQKQRYYSGHTDDILCLTACPNTSLVASGQIGRDPPVHVWDAESMATSAILKGQHSRG
ncbi:unnamed protein product, partial [Didymodactylos carnosus]